MEKVSTSHQLTAKDDSLRVSSPQHHKYSEMRYFVPSMVQQTTESVFTIVVFIYIPKSVNLWREFYKIAVGSIK
jgi:hypothetical protein